MGDCQKTGCSPAGEAVNPTPVNMPPATASAVTETRLAGSGSADSVQLAPPSEELAANGTSRPSLVTAVPTAATVAPVLATCSRAARVAPAGSGRSACCHVRPFAEVQADGWSPCEPTATNPAELTATAVIRRSPGPSSAPSVASPVRCQPFRVADHQAAA